MEVSKHYNGYNSLKELIEAAWSHPERQANVAVVGTDGTELTVGQLRHLCSGLANILATDHGLKPNSVVGIYMEKSTEYVAAYVSTLIAGGAYMPIDVSYPSALLSSILAESKPRVVFTKARFVDQLRSAYSGDIMELNDDFVSTFLSETSQQEPPAVDVQMDDLAYVVYSSGTTGKPKGICCPHRGSVFSYLSRLRQFPYSSDDRVASNVFFVWELLRPIIGGVPLYIVPDEVIFDPKRLCDYIQQNGITRMLFTPSLLVAVWDVMEQSVLSEKLSKLRTILLNGEVVTTWLVERILEVLPRSQIINIYSISECHDVATADLTTWFKETKNKPKYCPAGKLIDGVLSRIVDEDLKQVPIGMSGEICIGGPTLAKEYLERPELNKKRFFHANDQRYYRTGDWGYVLADSSLEICGRCDTMVKIRGYSVELPAIEAALMKSGMVTTCSVNVLGEEGSDKVLVAYVVPLPATSRRSLRSYLKHHLPFYMIPRYFVFMKNLPVVVATGKIDKKGLPKTVSSADAVEPEAQPQTATEKALAEIWCRILDLPAVDIKDSFFDVGGHSLLAVTMLAEVEKRLKAEVTIRDFLLAPSIFALAKNIDGDGDNHDHKIVLNLQEEVEKHAIKNPTVDISLRAFWRSLRWGDRWNKGCILLTGATGYLGSFVLAELLSNTQARIACVAREVVSESAEERVLRSLKKTGLLSDFTKNRVLERVTVHKGDVSLSLLGMTEDDYTYLSYDVDLVIHCAAHVNLMYPYSALYSANVLGTENILLFCYANKIKPLHYIRSTNALTLYRKWAAHSADTLTEKLIRGS